MSGFRRCSLVIAILGLLSTAQAASTCPFCSEERGPTFVGEFDEARLVIYGHFTKARATGGFGEGESDFTIEQVLKPNEFIEGKTVVTLPKFIDRPKTRHLLFCDIYKGKIDPYRGVEVGPDSDLLKYLTGARKLKGQSASNRLRYCFDFLNSPEFEVSRDAYREFAKADYKDYKEMARTLPADTIAGWLQDEKTPAYRYGLYASLLGHCGTAKHADVLLGMVNDPEKRKGSGVDGLIAGYVMLDPSKGWDFVFSQLDDAKKPFLMRYAALRTVRFLWEQRPDLVPRDKLVTGLVSMLKHPDMADFAIEDLRKWQRWELTDSVLDLSTVKTHSSPIVQKAVLRFALRSPQPRAAQFVRAQRQRDAEWVNDTEELLKLETDTK